ncbi:hypothetical protein V1478_013466 [Vespula squamosa]|uniref:Uncharacterized protein n=1 Tax=Vespula squamosa TaxID=30214 RepID=A0ABD2AB18_VESSQ
MAKPSTRGSGYTSNYNGYRCVARGSTAPYNDYAKNSIEISPVPWWDGELSPSDSRNSNVDYFPKSFLFTEISRNRFNEERTFPKCLGEHANM